MSKIKEETLHQAWLKSAVELFRQNFFDIPDVVATYGFPAPNSSDGFRGACHFPEEKEKKKDSKNLRPVIIIHPAEWNNPKEVLSVLLHECIHASFPKTEGHGVNFQSRAESIGLTKNEQGIYEVRSEELDKQLDEALKLLPEMPQDPLGRGEVKRQKGRMSLFICHCKYKIRCGRKELQATCRRCNTEFVLQE